MHIGEAAARSGVSDKMIRYYESIGLIGQARRTEGNYRAYCHDDIHTLRFIRHARRLGFSVKNTKQLLALWQDQNRSSAAVKTLTLRHIAELENKITELQAMVNTLKHLAERCSGDQRPHCPILADIASATANHETEHALPRGNTDAD